ncbi:hypothetical protein I4U23_011586 [Adineta vaga]|nr:hypothetical protein I4U23_011586 [Adineta vaga]
MSAPPRYIIRNARNERNFDDMNHVQPKEIRVSSIRPRSYNDEYQYQEPRYNNRQPIPPPPKSRSWCSKACVIGLLIGLTIGILIAAAVAIPLGLIKRPTPAFVRGEVSSTPNWIGTFQMDSSCDTSTCCCFTNQIFLIQTSSNLLQLNGSLSGRCIGSTSLVSYALSMPTNYAVAFTWFGQAIRVILSQDNSYLALVDNNVGYCSGTALRTSYSNSRINSVNLPLMIFMFLIIIGIII